MTGGTPPVNDAEYTRLHPNWRYSYQSMRSDILQQYRFSRESCKKIQVTGEKWVDSAPLSLSDLERLADEKAREILEIAIRRRKDVIEIGRGL